MAQPRNQIPAAHPNIFPYKPTTCRASQLESHGACTLPS